MTASDGILQTAALERVLDQPEMPDAQAELAAVLDRVMAKDPDFAARVRARWSEVAAGPSVWHGGVVNQFTRVS